MMIGLDSVKSVRLKLYYWNVNRLEFITNDYLDCLQPHNYHQAIYIWYIQKALVSANMDIMTVGGAVGW